jgi:hypothetical protein
VARENQSIGSKRPAVYLEEFCHRKSFSKVLRSHLIPHFKGSGIWDRNVQRGFKRFQNERLGLICTAFQREAGITLFTKE